MLVRLLVAGLALLLAGCAGSPSTSVPAATAPEAPLLGTRWVVERLVTGAGATDVPAGVVAALTFSEGRVDIEAGCNRGGADVSLDEGRIAFGPIALTKMACEGPATAVEAHVLESLAGAAGFEIQGDRLAIRGPGGGGLVLRAAP